MSKLIDIDVLDPESIKDAIAFFKDSEKWAKKKADELAKRLAEIGAEEARVHYAWAVGENNGNDDVSVRVEPMENGYKIIASGTDVFFIEFGTGTAAGSGYDKNEIEPPVPVYPASWSRHHAKQFYKNGYWYYGGKRYTKTTPYKGMYYASKKIRTSIKELAKEVFND